MTVRLGRRWMSAVIAGCAVLGALWTPSPAAAEDGYNFAVVPQLERRRLIEVWKPIVDAVAARSGVQLRLVSAMSVADFEHRLSTGAFDFVFTNPFHILMERDRQGYIPLVRDKAPLRGIVFVAADSPIASPKDLDGKTLAVPSLNAIGASILPRADLERLFGVRVVPRDVKTHTSVFLHVANGLVDAGGSVQKVMDEQEAEVRQRIKVIYTTRELPSHPVAAHPRVPAPVREAVRAALLELAATPEGGEMLSHVPMRAAVSTGMADYLPMADWGLDRFWMWESGRP